MPALYTYANLTLSQGLFGITKQLPYVGTRQPMENWLAQLARHPPKTRRACVIRWTEVFHRHLLPLLDVSARGVHDQNNLHRMIQCVEVSLPYSSSLISVNRKNEDF